MAGGTSIATTSPHRQKVFCSIASSDNGTSAAIVTAKIAYQHTAHQPHQPQQQQRRTEPATRMPSMRMTKNREARVATTVFSAFCAVVSGPLPYTWSRTGAMTVGPCCFLPPPPAFRGPRFSCRAGMASRPAASQGVPARHPPCIHHSFASPSKHNTHALAPAAPPPAAHPLPPLPAAAAAPAPAPLAAPLSAVMDEQGK